MINPYPPAPFPRQEKGSKKLSKSLSLSLGQGFRVRA